MGERYLFVPFDIVISLLSFQQLTTSAKSYGKNQNLDAYILSMRPARPNIISDLESKYIVY